MVKNVWLVVKALAPTYATTSNSYPGFTLNVVGADWTRPVFSALHSTIPNSTPLACSHTAGRWRSRCTTFTKLHCRRLQNLYVTASMVIAEAKRGRSCHKLYLSFPASYHNLPEQPIHIYACDISENTRTFDDTSPASEKVGTPEVRLV